MKRLFPYIIIVFFGLSLFSCGGDVSQPVEPETSQAKPINHIIINDESIADYKRRASRLGFDYDTEYSYSDFARIARDNDIGIAGAYEYLMLSTGGDWLNSDDAMHYEKQSVAWETVYFFNHDITWIKQIRRDDSGSHSFVKLLKLTEGRVPDLNLK